ncbi:MULTISPECIES: ABZJ_00895 family protein [unclassified Psychrobacter]|uniref:ABZJ_00895 family protein n=1 Tax=unclassified Psychrobacter TaxID=196806 RepID=UPI00402BD0EC
MSRQTTSLNKPQTPLQAQPKLARYVGFFAIGYTLASAIFMIIQTKLALNPQLVMVVSIIIGAYIAVSKFIKHQKRALARDEINKLMFGGVIIVWILTVIYFSAIWLWLFDAISREVLFEMAMQRPLPLLSSLMLMLALTLVSARISLWAVNRLLDPIRRLT